MKPRFTPIRCRLRFPLQVTEFVTLRNGAVYGAGNVSIEPQYAINVETVVLLTLTAPTRRMKTIARVQVSVDAVTIVHLLNLSCYCYVISAHCR